MPKQYDEYRPKQYDEYRPFEPCDKCPTPGECRREGRCRAEAMTQIKKRALREATRKGMISEGERRMMQKIMK